MPQSFSGGSCRSGCNYIKNHENMKGFGCTTAIFVISGLESGDSAATGRQPEFAKFSVTRLARFRSRKPTQKAF
jgi:hypothetical protein